MTTEQAFTRIETLNFAKANKQLDAHLKNGLRNGNIEYLIELAACRPEPNKKGFKNYQTGKRIPRIGFDMTNSCKSLIADKLMINMGSIDGDALKAAIDTAGNKEDGIKKFIEDNAQTQKPIFTKDDFNSSDFQTHQTDESNTGFEFVFQINLPEKFNNLVQDRFIKLDDGEVYDQIIEKTKASHFTYEAQGHIEIDYKHENGMRNLISMDVLQAFVDVANTIYPAALERAKQSAEDEAKETLNKKMERYGIKPS